MDQDYSGIEKIIKKLQSEDGFSFYLQFKGWTEADLIDKLISREVTTAEVQLAVERYDARSSQMLRPNLRR